MCLKTSAKGTDFNQKKKKKKPEIRRNELKMLGCLLLLCMCHRLKAKRFISFASWKEETFAMQMYIRKQWNKKTRRKRKWVFSIIGFIINLSPQSEGVLVGLIMIFGKNMFSTSSAKTVDWDWREKTTAKWKGDTKQKSTVRHPWKLLKSKRKNLGAKLLILLERLASEHLQGNNNFEPQYPLVEADKPRAQRILACCRILTLTLPARCTSRRAI